MSKFLENHFNMIGRLTADPEVITMKNDRELVTFSIAYGKYYKPKDGDPVITTSYFDVKVFGYMTKRAKGLIKGQMVAIGGTLEQEKWEKEGKNYSKVVLYADEILPIQIEKSGSAKPSQQTTGDVSADQEEPQGDLPF